MRVLCLGETLVDLICHRPVQRLADADAFVPHFGGSPANVAVIATRHGAQVELASAAGADDWGAWLRDRLSEEGVGLEWFALAEGVTTAVTFVTVDGGGEPTYRFYGDSIASAIGAIGPRLGAAAQACGALVFSSNTLLVEREREATMDVRAQMLEHGKPIVFDPNLRMERWDNPGRAVTLARGCLPGLFLLKCNRAEAEALSGESDPEAAAQGLLAGGVRNVVITLGDQGAIVRGEVRANAAAPTPPTTVVDATGAGDTLTGVLVAHLARTDFYPAAIAVGLREAVAEAARTVGRWGAT